MDLSWIFNGLKKDGKSRLGLADSLGRDVSVVSKILSGKRRLKVNEEEIIRSYLEMPRGDLVIDGIPSKIVFNVAFHMMSDKRAMAADPTEYAELFIEMCHYLQNLQDEEHAQADKIVSFEAGRRAHRSSES
ncbi:MAG: hypothetical protein JKY99_01525 [Rhizobiales bacterium]|nr:hypothetical protein [Hyphomicrobiales bacterium]